MDSLERWRLEKRHRKTKTTKDAQESELEILDNLERGTAWGGIGGICLRNTEEYQLSDPGAQWILGRINNRKLQSCYVTESTPQNSWEKVPLVKTLDWKETHSSVSAMEIKAKRNGQSA